MTLKLLKLLIFDGCDLKILALDTATEACSAAILVDSEINSKLKIAPRRHAELILGMVDELLGDTGIRLSDLDALAFGRGPGTFTGVRIAAGVVQGLAYGASLPVIPVSTLAALAQGANTDCQFIISAIDARMGEIYWGIFNKDDAGLVSAVTDEFVSAPNKIQITKDKTYYGTGSGWLRYHTIIENNLKNKIIGFDGETYPHSKDILLLARREFENGNSVPAQSALPIYLRNNVTV